MTDKHKPAPHPEAAHRPARPKAVHPAPAPHQPEFAPLPPPVHHGKIAVAVAAGVAFGVAVVNGAKRLGRRLIGRKG